MPNVLSVIPARGGSKSIPRKNIKLFGGHPLVKYSIDYSKKSKLVNKTIVSTEDKEIAEISIECGAEVPFMRANNLAEDDIPDFPVIEEALLKSEKVYNIFFDLIVLLRPTSPIRPIGLIEKGIDLILRNSDSTSLRSVTASNEHPNRQWFKEGNFMKGFFEEFGQFETDNLPRQKLKDSFFQSGDIEIIKRETILSGSISGSKVIPLEVSQDDVNDIDNYNDFKNAEKKIIR